MTAAKSLLHQMTLEHPTEFWNDGCEATSLAKAIEHGATGATSNPVLVLEAIEANPAHWREVLVALITDNPDKTEEEIAWLLVETVALDAAKLLEPIFSTSGGVRGRLSLQVSPRSYPSTTAMVAQGKRFAALAPNMAVKVPAVQSGIVAMEELTAAGVVVNATVSYSVPQALAVAEAVERGLARAKADGVDTSTMNPWVTIMVGRINDHLRDEAPEGFDADVIKEASTAIMRRAYRTYRERGYRATLLSAAMRGHHHWSAFIGGEMVVTIPPKWQDTFNASGVEVRRRIDDEVEPAAIDQLRKLPDFVRAYELDGMSIAEFRQFGACKKTLRQFLDGYDRLLAFVRESMLQ